MTASHRIVRVALAAVTSIALLAGAAPASAGADDRAQALATLRATRAALSAPGLVGALGAAARLAGAPVGRHASQPRPATLAEAVALLSGAVARAAEQARAAVPAGSPLAGAGIARRAEELAADVVRAAGDPARTAAAAAAIAAFKAETGSDAAARAQIVAGRQLAAAVEAALPALRAAGASGATGAAVDGCDLLDQAPALCLGGPGANTYTADYALQIDLGGDDVYRNGAGAADPGSPTVAGGNGIAAAVAIDVGGDDRYTTAIPTADGARAAHGASYGGIGMLVDLAGNDVYEAWAADTAYAQAVANGAGQVGLGLLADLAGDDAYVARSTTLNLFATVGNGAGSVGTGLLLDAAGDDTYRTESLRDQPLLNVYDNKPTLHPAGAVGSGAGVIGTGVFADGGGTDSVTVLAASTWPGSDAVKDISAGPPASMGVGGGATVSGAGVAVTGTGPTTWTIAVEGEGPRTGQQWAMGYGAAQGGFAGLSDAGGDDLYVLAATGRARRTLAIDDACACGEKAEASTGVRASGFYSTVAWGMGYGAVGGAGVVDEAAGNDRYALTADAAAVATVRDNRSAAGPVTATAESFWSNAWGQGHGSTGGLGVLSDSAGDDRYDAVAVSEATATASGAGAGATVRAVANSGQAQTFAQGYGNQGAGILEDAGGTDTYRAEAAGGAVASPPTSQTEEGLASASQGAVVTGVALLLDSGGEADVFTSVPLQPPCSGVRGGATWTDCGAGAGGGVNR